MSFVLTDYFIGFFDVLGQSTKLRDLQQVPTTDAERERAIAILKQTVGVVLGVRSIFDDFFKFAGQPTSFARSLPPAAQRQVITATASKVLHWGISDSMIVAVPLMETANPAQAVNGVRQSLLAAAGMWLLSLAAGHPLRGGVDVGVALQIRDNEVYGAALDRAYRLESAVAGGPRIVVGETCIDYLRFIRQRGATDALGEMAQRTAQECLSMFRQDEDGQAIIDGLGPVVREIFQIVGAPSGNGGLGSTVASAHAVVRKQLSDARAIGDAKLTARYESLGRYFDRNISAWSAG